MRSPELPLGKDSQTFEVRRGGVAVPHPNPFSVTEAPSKRIPEIEEKPSWRKTRLFLAGLVVAGIVAETTGAVYTELTNNVPLSADIPTLIQDAAWPYTLLESTLLKEKALPAFDTTANQGIVEVGTNTIAVPREQLKIVYDRQVEKNKDSLSPTVVFPVALTPGQRAGYRYAKPSTNHIDSQTGQNVTIEFPGSISLKLDKGVEILVMAENAEVFQYKPQIIGGKEYFVGLWIKFQQNGETYGFGISSADVRTFIPIGDASNAPVVPSFPQGGLDLSGAKNGLKLPLGTPVARINYITNVTDMNAGMNFKRYSRETGRWEQIRPNFVTDKSSGQVKLVVSSAQR